MTFKKEVSKDSCDLEIEIQNIASKYKFSPPVSSLEKVGDKWFIKMKDLKSPCLADVYGEDPSEIPEWIWTDIREMVSVLLEQEGIEYRDITSYNFIEKNGKVYMIDFGHAKYVDLTGKIDWFVEEFIDGENKWNPDYK